MIHNDSTLKKNAYDVKLKLYFACAQLHEDPFGSLWPKCLHQRVYVFVCVDVCVQISKFFPLHSGRTWNMCAHALKFLQKKTKQNCYASIAIRVYFRRPPKFHLHTHFLIPAFVILNVCCGHWLFTKRWMVTESLMTVTHLLDEGAFEKCWLNFSCDSDWDQ